jgi:hypothetical protein
MMLHAFAMFENRAWDEEPYDTFDGGLRLSRARVRKSFRGDLRGESTVEYLMAYAQDGSASFVGLERFVGWLGNRSGSFVLQHYGSLVGDISKVYWLVVAGSGTGEPRGLRGVGSLDAGNEKPYAITLDYEFETTEEASGRSLNHHRSHPPRVMTIHPSRD